MSYESVKAYFEKAGLAGRITERAQTGDTVEHARAAGWVDVCKGWFINEGMLA